MVASHAVGIAAVVACVLCGHQRGVPAHSMLQLCAGVFCSVCVCVFRWLDNIGAWFISEVDCKDRFNNVRPQ